jgi:predicted AAA+ superfamily ATPase
MLEKVLSTHLEVVKNVPMALRRYLDSEINWDQQAISVTGARGTGKTTMLLQHYHQRYRDPQKCLYISADNIIVAAMGIWNIAEEHFKLGGEAIIIDEIHKYPNWETEVKNVIDTFKKLKVIVSGSSSIAIRKKQHDLSRRLVNYQLHGLSFREYLNFSKKQKLAPIDFDDLIKNHVAIAAELTGIGPILKFFKDYLKEGYYPYFMEGTDVYLNKLTNVIEKIICEDIAIAFNINDEKIPTLRKMLWLIASSAPFTPNIVGLSRDFSLSKEYVYLYLEYLEKGHLLQSLRSPAKGARMVRKSDKIFLENPNLIYAILRQINLSANEGSIREAFFLNQVKMVKPVFSASQGDFTVDHNLCFEVGGKNKTNRQIKDVHNGFIAMDGIDVGHKNKIPLYLFGMLY